MDPPVASSLPEFLEHTDELINKSRFTYTTGHASVWYRGQACYETWGTDKDGYKKWELLPSLYRLRVEKGQKLTRDFLNGYRAYWQDEVYSGWDVYTLMQHYALPTRLLDWTTSSLIALYFALDTPYDEVYFDKYETDQLYPDGQKKRKPKPPPEEVHRVVWMIHPTGFNKVSIGGGDEPGPIYSPSDPFRIYDPKLKYPEGKRKALHCDMYLPDDLRGFTRSAPFEPLPKNPIAIEVPLSNKRIVAQKGCFTVHGDDEEPLDVFLNKQAPSETHLLCIKIREADRDKIREQLFAAGIKEDFIYQDLDHLSKRIQREYFG